MRVYNSWLCWITRRHWFVKRGDSFGDSYRSCTCKICNITWSERV